MLEIVTKLPLIKLRRKSTATRIIARYGNNPCVIYSGYMNKYKRGDDWVDNPEMAEINTLSECFKATKDINKDNIVYCIIKV